MEQGQVPRIESGGSPAVIRDDNQPVRDSLTTQAEVMDRTVVEFDDITLAYEPSLLGEINYLVVAATPNQGLFEQPSPAYTWIGFEAEGTQAGQSSQWSLQREPQIFIYSLHGFGSFAPADVRARSQIDSFRVPANWQPEPITPGMGSVLAEWRLGIPGVEGDQTLAFFAPPFAELQPPDVVEELDFEIGGQSSERSIRSGANFVSYEYYSAGSAESLAQGDGSFGIHMTLPAADPDLESTLDMLATSARFLPGAGSDSLI